MLVGFSDRFRGLTMGPDGALYAAVDEGKTYRGTDLKPIPHKDIKKVNITFATI